MHLERIINFIFDRMKGLSKALVNAWSSLYHHRYCLRHIKANFQKEFKDSQLHRLLYEAGCASDPLVYKAKRKELKEIFEPAYN